jgi:hypothetical protein
VDRSEEIPKVPAVMIAKTYFLAKDSHRIGLLSLREKLTLRDHRRGNSPEYPACGVHRPGRGQRRSDGRRN